MYYVSVKNRVEDYAQWRTAFDANAETREAAGATEEVYVMRNAYDPNEVTVIMGWNDIEKGKAFAQSAELREAMKKAGVISQPQVDFLTAAN
jgi:quinol monooxygenase YgiN